jgi:hypothetical protein
MFKQYYLAQLDRIRGWLLTFYLFASFSVLAFLRESAASVVSGSSQGATSWLVGVALLFALIGMAVRVRVAYFLALAIGVYLLTDMSLTMLAEPGMMLYRDWLGDMPMLAEWLIVLGWLIYFLRSQRLYSRCVASAAERGAA